MFDCAQACHGVFGVALALISGSTPLAAQCLGRALVVDCMIGAKALTVCIDRERASYAFGPRGAPELAMSEPLSAVVATPWPGFGRSIYEDITFKNNAYRYTVWIALDRLDPDHPTSGGVIVSKGATEITGLRCDGGDTEIGIFAIADAMSEAGYCVDRGSGTYRQTCAGED